MTIGIACSSLHYILSKCSVNFSLTIKSVILEEVNFHLLMDLSIKESCDWLKLTHV